LLTDECIEPIDELLNHANASGVCNAFMPEGQDCQLPLNPGSYRPGVYEMTFPNIPDLIKPLLKGKLDTKIFVVMPDGTESACVQFRIELG